MITAINKPVRRKTVGTHRGKHFIVTIAPGDVIGFREERTHKTYWMPLAACFDMAVKMEVAAQRAAKLAKKRRGVK